MNHSEFDLTGERILITGASSGIGMQTARVLADAGACVALHSYRAQEKVEQLQKAIEQRGGRAFCVAADLTCEQDVVALFNHLQADWGVPNMLVNMAARQDVVPFDQMNYQHWRELMAVNQDALFLVGRQFCQLARENNNNAIVNIASIEGLDPAVGHGHYATSKAAMLMYGRALAVEMAAKNIRVNAISPGLIDRPGLEQDWPEGVASWLERCPSARLGQPQDVANAVRFLLSPAASWINGANLVVDGGMSARARW